MARLEGRSHEFTLVTVELPFATENAIANRRSEGIMDCYAFVKVISVFDQNALDVFWFVEQLWKRRIVLSPTGLECDILYWVLSRLT
jgi:hypothetical protein